MTLSRAGAPRKYMNALFDLAFGLGRALRGFASDVSRENASSLLQA